MEIYCDKASNMMFSPVERCAIKIGLYFAFDKRRVAGCVKIGKAKRVRLQEEKEFKWPFKINENNNISITLLVKTTYFIQFTLIKQ